MTTVTAIDSFLTCSPISTVLQQLKNIYLIPQECIITIPTHGRFIEPILRYPATEPEGAAARDVHKAATNALGLDDSQQAKVITSGQPVYRNCIGWAHDRLKRAGLSQDLSRGRWYLIPAGFSWVTSHPQPMAEQETNHLALVFVNIKLGSRPNAIDLDSKANFSDHEELAKSSPDDRSDQALKELRDAVADEVLENLLQASPSRFEVIVLDVLHRLGYGGHCDDLQCVDGIGDSGADGVISFGKLGLERVYVQAKRWQSTAGRPELQVSYSALAGQKAKRGVFIITSEFTSQAHDFAQSVEGMVLIDGKRLMHLVIGNEIGASSRLLKVPEPDMNYFE